MSCRCSGPGCRFGGVQRGGPRASRASQRRRPPPPEALAGASTWPEPRLSRPGAPHTAFSGADAHRPRPVGVTQAVLGPGLRAQHRPHPLREEKGEETRLLASRVLPQTQGPSPASHLRSGGRNARLVRPLATLGAIFTRRIQQSLVSSHSTSSISCCGYGNVLIF